MTAPLRVSFDVGCSAEHAFNVWTSGIATWWPADHTVTGQAGIVVVMQSGVGGRIYERAPDGVEHDWGEVTVWNPPTRLENPAPALPGGDRRSRPAEILM
jgi:hypothetical protein